MQILRSIHKQYVQFPSPYIQMSDKHLPKATMVNFIKDHVQDKRKVSAEFTNLMLQISKQFIQKVSTKANEVCEGQGKKTITNEHLYKALKQLGIGNVVGQLQTIDQTLKHKHQEKEKVKQQVQKNIQRINSQCQGLDQQELQKKKIQEEMPLIIGTKRPNKKKIIIQDSDEDFAAMLQKQVDAQYIDLEES